MSQDHTSGGSRASLRMRDVRMLRNIPMASLQENSFSSAPASTHVSRDPCASTSRTRKASQEPRLKQVFIMFPYVVTVLVLLFSFGKTTDPGALGQPFERGRR